VNHTDTLRAALARINALRAAHPEITTPSAGVNPLDLNLLDPLTPGRFPGIGTPGRQTPLESGETMRPEPADGDMRPEPVEGQGSIDDPSTSSGTARGQRASPRTDRPG